MRFSRYLLLACCLFSLLFFSGCGQKKQVRHLTSDVCLLLPGQMSKKDVLSFMGEPNLRRAGDDGKMEWIYYDVRKSSLRKTPLVGDKMGHENYDVVKVTFDGELIFTCVYRSYDEKEFAGLGIVVENKAKDE